MSVMMQIDESGLDATWQEPTFRLVEIFESLQGEGYNTGMPAIFIRLGRCDLSCSWCDTDYLKYEHVCLSTILESLQDYTVKTIIITGGEPSIHPQIAHLLDALKERGYYLCMETNGLHPVPEQIDYIATSPKACYGSRYRAQCISSADEVRIVVDTSLAEERMTLPRNGRSASHDKRQVFEPVEISKPSTSRMYELSAEEQQFLCFAQEMAQKIKAKQYFLSPLERDGQMNIHQTIRLLGHLNQASFAQACQAQDISTTPPHWQLSVQTHKWAGIE